MWEVGQGSQWAAKAPCLHTHLHHTHLSLSSARVSLASHSQGTNATLYETDRKDFSAERHMDDAKEPGNIYDIPRDFASPRWQRCGGRHGNEAIWRNLTYVRRRREGGQRRPSELPRTSFPSTEYGLVSLRSFPAARARSCPETPASSRFTL